jgi:hypothetical protein
VSGEQRKSNRSEADNKFSCVEYEEEQKQRNKEEYAYLTA